MLVVFKIIHLSIVMLFCSMLEINNVVLHCIVSDGLGRLATASERIG